jgi:hypothetical protein
MGNLSMVSPAGKSLLLGCCAIAGAAFAQQSNPLIGEWRGIIRDANNYSMAFDITYYPNYTYVQTLAVPPNRDTGTGSGVIYSRGQYRLTSDHSVEFNEQEKKECPGGDMSFCLPLNAAGVSTISFRMDGTDKVVSTSDGTVSYRVR